MATITRYSVIEDMLTYGHILVAGSAGSGKSTLMDLFIYSACFLPNEPAIYLVDPKKVDLWKYRNMKNVVRYVDEPGDAVAMFRKLIDTMEKRFDTIRSKNQTMTDEQRIYIFIDEVADLVDEHKEVVPLIKRLVRLGRAAGIIVVMATQTLLADILETSITSNITCRVALKTATSAQSRCIVGVSGAERLPQHGYGIIAKGSEIKTYELPKVPDADLKAVIEYKERR